jgi:hypothetical protein
MERFEDYMVPLMGSNFGQSPPTSSVDKHSSPYSKREDVDCFTLKHNMLEVCTNSEQYQMILDIVNNLVLFVDPKKKMAQERRRRLWFELANKSKMQVKTMVQLLQKDLRELVAIIRWEICRVSIVFCWIRSTLEIWQILTLIIFIDLWSVKHSF